MTPYRGMFTRHIAVSKRLKLNDCWGKISRSGVRRLAGRPRERVVETDLGVDNRRFDDRVRSRCWYRQFREFCLKGAVKISMPAPDRRPRDFRPYNTAQELTRRADQVDDCFPRSDSQTAAAWLQALASRVKGAIIDGDI